MFQNSEFLMILVTYRSSKFDIFLMIPLIALGSGLYAKYWVDFGLSWLQIVPSLQIFLQTSGSSLGYTFLHVLQIGSCQKSSVTSETTHNNFYITLETRTN